MNHKFVLCVVLILIFAMAARTPLDSDMWWHLRAGEEMVKSHHILNVDLFSYTRTGEQWINPYWLSQVGMYILFDYGAYLALALAVASLATVSMGLVYLQMDGNSILRAFILTLGAVVASMVWSPRPQLVSLVMFGAVGYLLYLYKWRKHNRLWLLIPLFILWANLHPGYVLGLILIASMIAGELFNHLLGYSDPAVVEWKGVVRLGVWGLLAGLAVLINPNGLSIWVIPFKTVGMGVLREFISEWASPDFHQLVQQPFLWLLFGCLASIGISGKHVDGSDLVSMVVFAYMAFLARRNYGPFAMVAAPVLSRHLWTACQSWWTRNREKFQPVLASMKRRIIKGNAETPGERREVIPLHTNLKRFINSTILVLLGLTALVKVVAVSSPTLVDQSMHKFFPIEAVRWIQTNKPSGQMFNDYNWGGFLLWSLRDYPVFADGRTDLYDDELLRKYLKVIHGDPGWETILDQYDINFILMDNGSGLSRVINNKSGWKEVYQDDMAILLIRQPVH